MRHRPLPSDARRMQHPLSDAPHPFVSFVASRHGLNCTPPKGMWKSSLAVSHNALLFGNRATADAVNED